MDAGSNCIISDYLESWSLEMLPFHRSHTTSYWRSTVTMAVSLAISEIFNVEKCCDLEIQYNLAMSTLASPADFEVKEQTHTPFFC